MTLFSSYHTPRTAISGRISRESLNIVLSKRLKNRETQNKTEKQIHETETANGKCELMFLTYPCDVLWLLSMCCETCTLNGLLLENSIVLWANERANAIARVRKKMKYYAVDWMAMAKSYFDVFKKKELCVVLCHVVINWHTFIAQTSYVNITQCDKYERLLHVLSGSK